MQLRDKIADARSASSCRIPRSRSSVTDVRSYRVSVLGEVQRPGVLQLKAQTTILEAIAMAGGFRDFASPSKIVILRKNGERQTEKIPLQLQPRRQHRATKTTSSLRSGDVVVVP